MQGPPSQRAKMTLVVCPTHSLISHWLAPSVYTSYSIAKNETGKQNQEKDKENEIELYF